MRDSWITFNLCPHEVGFIIEDTRIIDAKLVAHAEINLGDDRACFYFCDRERKTDGDDGVLFCLNVPLDILKSLCAAMEVGAKSCREEGS